MRVIVLTEEEWLNMVDEDDNPPVIHDQKEENQFQAGMRSLYNRLVETLSAFGEEGDHYGVSDFAVRPDLRDRPTVKAPPAGHVREFNITIITRKFHRSGYLAALHNFLSTEAPAYRMIIAKDFDPEWTLRVCLTVDLAKLFCTNNKELSCLERILAKL